MTNSNFMEIREKGFRVLVQGLGTTGAVNFLRQFEGGSGDYTKEREAILEGMTIDEIAGRILEHNKNRTEPDAKRG